MTGPFSSSGPNYVSTAPRLLICHFFEQLRDNPGLIRSLTAKTLSFRSDTAKTRLLR
ncbi:hypothetical protein BDV93DRAFT_526824 [Ceratobasidium sp. AG-I]|nr:hypothetical protein BDV93DRAFT_527847 [Ceratobasidium sp. AG-I]KAF8598295.1 hypothetical protein BDV93DRAFT_526824 [Ceratobasidium sp. AG-I]